MSAKVPFYLVRRKEYTFRVKDGAHHYTERGQDTILRIGDEFKTFEECDKMPRYTGKFEKVNTETVAILVAHGNEVKIFRDEDDDLLDEVKAAIKAEEDPTPLITPPEPEDPNIIDLNAKKDQASDNGESDVDENDDEEAEDSDEDDEENAGPESEPPVEEKKDEVKKEGKPKKVKKSISLSLNKKK